MTEAQARTTANVVLAAGVIGAAYYVMKTPSLRRKVWQMARTWATGPLAVWAATEIRRAWDASARIEASPSSRETGEPGARRRSAAGYDERGALPSRLRTGG
jgi:hypothetical protein